MKHSLLICILSIPLMIQAQSVSIWKAIQDAEPSQVQACIDAKVDLGARDAKERTPLLAAVAAEGGLVVPERQRKIVKSLLDAGSDVNATDAKGYTASHYAAYHGGYDLLAMLLDAKANLTVESNAGETPLLLAARGPLIDQDRLKTIELLLNAGANAKQVDNEGHGALHLLCAHRTKLEVPEEADALIAEMVKLLISKGADLKASDAAGNTPFSNAIQQGHFQTATLLLDKGASALSTVLSSYSALHFATEQGNLPMIDRLLKAGIDINRTAGDKRQADEKAYFFPKGSTPLDLALISEHESKNPVEKKNWKALATALSQRGGVTKTFQEYVKGFHVLKGDSKPGSSKIMR